MYSLPCAYQLRTNSRLTSEEETKARRTISKTLSKLTAVESEIVGLQHRLVTLRQKNKETKNYIELHRELLSPIRRLLPEILQEVFWRCLPTAHNSVYSFEEAPLLLGRVCRQWRRIAYSTPELWTSLHIVAAPLTCPRAEARFEAFNAWLGRSGILPLSISMSTIEKSKIFTHEFRPYFDLIAKHARRWKSIHLHVDLNDPIIVLAEIRANNLPLLEALYIHEVPPVAEDASASSFAEKDGFLFAPLLHDLSVHYCSSRLLDLPVRWGQLTCLSYFPRPFEMVDILELLTSCSSLETCSMSFGIPNNSFLFATNYQTSGNRPRVVLSKLRTLKIYGGLGPDDDSLIILDKLATPALRHFSYQPPEFPLGDVPFTQLSFSLGIFRSFFQRLNEPLEELDFAIDRIMTRYLMEFLPLVPGLKRLSFRHFNVSNSSFNDYLLSEFIPHEHSRHCSSCLFEDEEVEELEPIIPSFSCLCPKLEVLDVDDAFLSKHVLLEFLQSRLVDYDKYNVARLRRFAISFDFRLEDYEMTQEIDKLVEESGMVDMRLSRRLDNQPLNAGTVSDFNYLNLGYYYW